MATAICRPPDADEPHRANRRDPASSSLVAELAGIDFTWLDELASENVANAFIEWLTSEPGEDDSPDDGLFNSDHYGPLRAAVAAVDEVEAENRFNLVRWVMETPPVTHPARRRHHGMRLV